MIAPSLALLLLFPAILVLPGFLVARRLPVAPLEKLAASVLFSCVAAYLVAFSLYLLHLAPAWSGLLAAAGVAGAAATWREWRDLLRQPEVRACLGPWAVVTGWTLVALALVRNYSGGAWGGDWIEHYERSLFFLKHWPLDFRFIRLYALPARPPLANLVTGSLMALTGLDYSQFQLATTLFNSLAFLPAIILLRTWTRTRSAPWLLALLWMLNPMMLQNATFAWTKQSTAFFVLAGLWFFLRARREGGRTRPALTFLALAAGCLCHYSAVPYLVATAALYLILERRALRRVRGWRELALVASAGVALLATWFAWSWWRYGGDRTFLSNTTATRFSGLGAWLRSSLENIWVTLVPQSPWRLHNGMIFGGTDPVAQLRDYYFMIYQVNVLWAIGSGAWIAVLWLAVRAWRRNRAAAGPDLSRTAWVGWLTAVFLLGTICNPPDHWGVAHICLQPLVMLALIFLAARMEHLPALVRRALVTTTAVDFLLGSVLQLVVEHRGYFAAWLHGAPLASLAAGENINMRNNVHNQVLRGLTFWGESIHAPALPATLLLALLLLVAGRQWWRARRET